MSLRILGVSGHRPAKAGFDGAKLVMFAQHVLLKNQADLVLTGMAVGWDQAVAEACVRLCIPFTAVVPFEGQESRWPAAVQKRYHELLTEATTVVYVSQPGYSEDKMRKRNRWIAKRATKAVVLYDGLGDSGTAQFVKQAENCGLPFVNVWGEWQAFETEVP